MGQTPYRCRRRPHFHHPMPCRCCNCYCSPRSSTDSLVQHLWGGGRGSDSSSTQWSPHLSPLCHIRPLDCTRRHHEWSPGGDVPPFQCGKHNSRMSPPHRGSPWCQRCRRSRHDASAYSLAACSRLSIASWAATASRATTTAARRHWHSSMAPPEC